MFSFKKAQITFFILVGLLLFVGAILFVFSSNQTQEGMLPAAPPEILVNKELTNLVKLCTIEEVKNAIDTILEIGGFVGSTREITVREGFVAPLYFDARDLSPHIIELENTIQQKVGTFTCPGAQELGWQFDALRLEKLELQKEVITVNLAAIQATKGEATILLDKLTVKVPNKLGLLFASTKEYLRVQDAAKKKFMVTRMADIGAAYNVTFKMDEIKNGEFMLVVTTQRPFIDDGFGTPPEKVNTMQLPFIVRFDWS